MVVFLKAELGFFVLLFSVIFHSTCLVNVLEGGVTSALYETLRRLAYRVTDRIHAKQLLRRLVKDGT